MIEPDLPSPEVARWPAFARAGVEAGVLAVFAFPLHIGWLDGSPRGDPEAAVALSS